MNVSAAPNIFDVFNARQLSPQDVARTFVPPPHFVKLVRPTHSLVVGPRGSGKTTLLKMLHPAALHAWSHDQADEYRKQVSFTGVFIATDINWNEQVKGLGDGRLDPETHRHFTKSAFTTQILKSLVDSMSFRAGRSHGSNAGAGSPAISATDEEQISIEMVRAWELEDTIPTFEGVQVSLSRRLSEIRQLASIEATRGSKGRSERLASHTFLHLDFLYAGGLAVDIFNARLGQQGWKWALLFDEVELAPAWIRTLLVRYLRSVDERFLFKISLSPYSVDFKGELDRGPHGPGASQDFEAIRLWYVNKQDGYPFCQELLKNMLLSRKIEPRAPEQLFGWSEFATKDDEWKKAGTAYRRNSSIGKMVRELAAKDKSFRAYLRQRRINPETMHQIGGLRRAGELRKARSVIALRHYFRGWQNGGHGGRTQDRRSRKSPTVYGGATALFAMVEGNPRWLIGIVSQLLDRHQRAQNMRIGKPAQVRQVLEAANIFRAMLRTVPCDPLAIGRRGLLALLDPIGEYFSRAAIDGEFDPDPPSSFIVDSDASDEEVWALGKALNAGAIVYAPTKGDVGILENLRGKRFRLSYIFAPYYCTPLTLGQSRSLRSILRDAEKVVRNTEEDRVEPSLFE